MLSVNKKPPRGGCRWRVCGGGLWGGCLCFGCELIARSGAIFSRGFVGGFASPPQHARRHGKPGTATAFTADLIAVGSQYRRPLIGTVAAGANNCREWLPSGFALFNIGLINPPLVPWADLREVADAV